MSYKVRISRRSTAQIQSWQLPDRILVEVYIERGDYEQENAPDAGG